MGAVFDQYTAPSAGNDMSFGMFDPYGTPARSELVVRFPRTTVSPFTSSFAVGAIPTPTFPEETFIAFASALTCPTRSFQAVEVSPEPVFTVGRAPHAADAKTETAQTDAKANANQNPCFIPTNTGFVSDFIYVPVSATKSAHGFRAHNSKRVFDSNQPDFPEASSLIRFGFRIFRTPSRSPRLRLLSSPRILRRFRDRSQGDARTSG